MGKNNNKQVSEHCAAIVTLVRMHGSDIDKAQLFKQPEPVNLKRRLGKDASPGRTDNSGGICCANTSVILF